MTKYIFEVNEDKTECAVLKPSRKAGQEPKLLGKVIVYGNGSKYRTEKEPDVMWLPVNLALIELGWITREGSNLAELGF